MVKNPPAMQGDAENVGRLPGGGHGNPLQFSHLKNPMDRGAWWAAVNGVTKSQIWLKWISSSGSSNSWISRLISEHRIRTDRSGCNYPTIKQEELIFLILGIFLKYSLGVFRVSGFPSLQIVRALDKFYCAIHFLHSVSVIRNLYHFLMTVCNFSNYC